MRWIILIFSEGDTELQSGESIFKMIEIKLVNDRLISIEKESCSILYLKQMFP